MKFFEFYDPELSCVVKEGFDAIGELLKHLCIIIESARLGDNDIAKVLVDIKNAINSPSCSSSLLSGNNATGDYASIKLPEIDDFITVSSVKYKKKKFIHEDIDFCDTTNHTEDMFEKALNTAYASIITDSLKEFSFDSVLGIINTIINAENILDADSSNENPYVEANVIDELGLTKSDDFVKYCKVKRPNGCWEVVKGYDVVSMTKYFTIFVILKSDNYELEHGTGSFSRVVFEIISEDSSDVDDTSEVSWIGFKTLLQHLLNHTDKYPVVLEDMNYFFIPFNGYAQNEVLFSNIIHLNEKSCSLIDSLKDNYNIPFSLL